MWMRTRCLMCSRVPRTAAASRSKSSSERMNASAIWRCSSGVGPAGGGGRGACDESAASSAARRPVLDWSVTLRCMAGGGGRSGGRGRWGMAAPRGGSRLPAEADAPESRLRCRCAPDLERPCPLPREWRCPALMGPVCCLGFFLGSGNGESGAPRGPRASSVGLERGDGSCSSGSSSGAASSECGSESSLGTTSSDGQGLASRLREAAGRSRTCLSGALPIGRLAPPMIRQ